MSTRDDEAGKAGPRALPFPSSLCHLCAAPPRYVDSDKGAIFIHCPLLKRYPPQPVGSCSEFRPRRE